MQKVLKAGACEDMEVEAERTVPRSIPHEVGAERKLEGRRRVPAEAPVDRSVRLMYSYNVYIGYIHYGGMHG